MNGWDLFTYAAVAFLVLGSAVVFGFFLKDARRILREMDGNPEPSGRDPVPPASDPRERRG
jgi:hypothetical protein